MINKIEQKDGVAIIRLSGKLIGGDFADEFQTEIQKQLDAGTKQILLDLAKVNWISSSGIGILVRGFTTVKNSGGEIVLAGATEKVNNVFVITKLVLVFKNFESEEEALEHFSK